MLERPLGAALDNADYHRSAELRARWQQHADLLPALLAAG